MAYDREYSPTRGERIDRTEIVERSTTADGRASRKAAPMWVWLLPLVVAAIVLAWYVFTRGEPNPPDIGGIPIERTERVIVEEEPRPIIVVPEIEPDDPPVGSEEPAPPAARSPTPSQPTEPAAEESATAP